MNIKMVAIDSIKPYENNPRRNEQAVEAVAASIRDFGFRQPIVIDKNGVIIAGHTRYKAAKKLGMRSVPVELADDLTEEQARAYRLADNKTGELASWDFAMLDLEMVEIQGIEMSEYGFEATSGIEESIDRLFDESPEPAQETKRHTCPQCGYVF